MKIFDCFLYNNENLVLDIRLNTLFKYVDKFIIVESKFDHSVHHPTSQQTARTNLLMVYEAMIPVKALPSRSLW